MWDFLQQNWAVIALIISEVLAFLPTKVSSIVQVIMKIANMIFGKKEVATNKSANKKVSISNNLFL